MNNRDMEDYALNSIISVSDEKDTGTKTNSHRKHSDSHRLAAIDVLRLLFLLFMCLNYFGVPGSLGIYVQIYSAFAPIAFFIVSGYLVLGDDGDMSNRILRTIKRSIIALLIAVPVYILINYFYYSFFSTINIFDVLTDKAMLIDFFAFNIWPLRIGAPIWYILAIIYAYIIIYVLNKLKLLRYDWIIMVVLMLFMIVSGELAHVFGFNMFGRDHISGNFLTRALPYILAGRLLKKHEDFFSGVHWLIYVSVAAFGLMLTQLELDLLATYNHLSYTGHFIGMAIFAASVSLPFLTGIVKKFDWMNKRAKKLYSVLYKVIYYIFHPLGFILNAILKQNVTPEFYSAVLPLLGIATFTISMVIALLSIHIVKEVSMQFGRLKRKSAH